MSVSLLNDSSQASKNPPIPSNKNEVNHNLMSATSRKQVQVLYAIKFLTSMSYGLSSVSLCPVYNEVENAEIIEFKCYLDSLKSNSLIYQTIFNIGFGLISDKFGRKPVLNACLLGSSLCIGLSKFNKNAAAFSLLCTLNGDFNCSSDVIKTMAVELSDRSSRPSTLVYLHVVELLGLFVGFPVGYILNWCFPLPFLEKSEFKSNPNPKFEIITLIPCLISTGINFVAYLLSRYYLNETMYKNNTSLDMVNVKSESHKSLDKLSKTERSTIFGLKISKNSKIILIGLSILSLAHKGFLNTEFDWFTMMDTYAGLSINIIDHIYSGLLLIAAMIAIPLNYPYAVKKFGALKFYKFLFLLTPAIFAAPSVLAHFVKKSYKCTIIIPLTIFFSLQRGINLLYNTSSNLLLAESSESTNNLGTLCGISSAIENVADLAINSISSTIQVIFPNSIVSSKLNYKTLNWSFLTTLTLTGYWISTKIKNF